MIGFLHSMGYLLALLLTVGCAVSGPPAKTGPDDDRASLPPRPGPRRIVVGVPAEPNVHASAPGSRGVIREFVMPGMALVDDGGVLRPVLAETVPSLENGLWTLQPNGRMETTWKIRAAVRWHDGEPLTADDLLFTLEVGRDPELPNFVLHSGIDGARVLDAHTVVITWNQPFINAHRVFRAGTILPSHRLASTYHGDTTSFENLAFWSADYVGTGAYRVHEWVPGSHVILEANADYVLGRPRIDQIELRQIPDTNAMLANLLTGTVQIAPFDVGLDAGLLLREQWRDGSVGFHFAGRWVSISPQFVEPRPTVVGDVRFRRALLHAIDRQEMANTLQAGLSPVAHSFLSPGQPDYHEIEARLPHYQYDPGASARMLAALGYTRGPDAFLRDAAGQRLEIEVRADSAYMPAAQAVNDYWQRAGVAVEQASVSPAQALADPEYVATFPAFYVRPRPNDVGAVVDLLASRARLPENRFRAFGIGNISRYVDPAFDALVQRYMATIPLPERVEALGQIVYHIADELIIMGLYYHPNAEPFANRLVNVKGERASGSLITWNVHEWDLKSQPER